MPLYAYECEVCGVRFERRQSFSDEPVRTCPECGGPVHRLVQPVGIIFKGPGFYVTDNRSSSRRRSKKSNGGSSKESSSTSGETSD
ncbi:MAG TPA: zinc ribbon domain-containing protein [Chloroflexi bacterium]|nr:zinc ribbon domain-containing protein [Chloroflexota bacterium]